MVSDTLLHPAVNVEFWSTGGTYRRTPACLCDTSRPWWKPTLTDPRYHKRGGMSPEARAWRWLAGEPLRDHAAIHRASGGPFVECARVQGQARALSLLWLGGGCQATVMPCGVCRAAGAGPSLRGGRTAAHPRGPATQPGGHVSQPSPNHIPADAAACPRRPGLGSCWRGNSWGDHTALKSGPTVLLEVRPVAEGFTAGRMFPNFLHETPPDCRRP